MQILIENNSSLQKTIRLKSKQVELSPIFVSTSQKQQRMILFIHSFTHSLNSYLLTVYYGLCTTVAIFNNHVTMCDLLERFPRYTLLLGECEHTTLYFAHFFPTQQLSLETVPRGAHLHVVHAF